MRLGTISYFGDFVACPAALLVVAVETVPRHGAAAIALWGLSVGGGVLAWTLIEYAVHRWIYHRYQPFKTYHDMHHAEPEAHIGAPSFVTIVLIFAVIFAPLSVFDVSFAGAVTCGLLIGYAAYVSVHHAVHQWKPKVGSPLYALRRLHARHHYAPVPSNFGVTSGLWDRVFGTMFAEPRRHAVTDPSEVMTG